MKCKQAEPLVAAYADGEVDALRAYWIKRHLRGCVGCTAKQHGILALRARIGAEVPYFVASPALHARVRATMGAVRAIGDCVLKQNFLIRFQVRLIVRVLQAETAELARVEFEKGGCRPRSNAEIVERAAGKRRRNSVGH